MTEVSDLFQEAQRLLKVSNADQIRMRRDEITKALNKEFIDSDSTQRNRLMVGSWGRRTAIDGVSDLDMIYILPRGLRSEYRKEGGPSKALKRVKKAISAHYSKTSIRVDHLVVVVQFSNFKFEVQPCFESDDGSFEYPDTYSDSWKRTDPRAEMLALKTINDETNGNARALCRLTRAWKRKHEVSMNGLLIDTLVARFFGQISESKLKSFPHDEMVLEFFKYLSGLPDQNYWYALGSGQRVNVKRKFQGKAKTAVTLCEDAIAAEGKSSMNDKWREVFGRFIPRKDDSRSVNSELLYTDTEEFIEQFHSVNLKYDLILDCDVEQKGFRPRNLRQMLSDGVFLFPEKTLTFRVSFITVPEPYELKWKVLNRGDEAERRNEIRGQIFKGDLPRTHVEYSKFRGNHYVECYAIREGVVVARGHIDVPIQNRV